MTITLTVPQIKLLLSALANYDCNLVGQIRVARNVDLKLRVALAERKK